MAKFRINPAALKKLQSDVQAFGAKKVQQLTRALGNWSLDVVEEMGKEIAYVNAIDQGLLHAATTATPVRQEGPKLKVTVFNPLEYSVIVEFGRKAGGKPPPLLPLIGWAARHGMLQVLTPNPSMEGLRKELAASAAILRNMGRGGGKKGKQKAMDPKIADLLVVRKIAQKIAEEGVAGRRPFGMAWDKKAATFKQDIANMVK